MNLALDAAHGESEMSEESREESVVLAHYTKTLHQRFSVITGGSSFCKIINRDPLAEAAGMAGMLQAAYTPFVVRRKTIIGTEPGSDFPECHESLMAYNHSIRER